MENDPEGGDHVMCQMRHKSLSSTRTVSIVVDSQHRTSTALAVIRYNVSNELTFETVTVCNDSAVADVKVVDNGLLDDTRHDRVAANLNHPTNSTSDLEQTSFGNDASQIAGPVFAGVGLVGVCVDCEGFCGSVWKVEVSSSEQFATDIELAWLTWLERLLFLIENIRVSGIHRRTDGAVCSVGRQGWQHLSQITASNFVGLTGTVAVEQASVGQSLDGTSSEIGGDDFTVEPKRSKFGQLGAEIVVTSQDSCKQSGCHERLCNLFGGEQLDELDWVVAGMIWDGISGGTTQKRTDHLPDKVDVASHAVGRLKIVDSKAKVVGLDRSAMRVGDTFWFSRGTR